MATHPIFESDFDCLTEWDFDDRKMRCNIYEDVLLVVIFIGIWYSLVLIWYFFDAFNSPNIIFPAIPNPDFLIKWYKYLNILDKSLPSWDNSILLILFLKRFRYFFLKIVLL